MRFLLFCLLPLFATAQPDDRAGRMDSLLSARAAAGDFNGVVLIVEDGKELLHRAYGVADPRDGRALTTNSVFELASVSKQFTATAVALLAHRGQVDLDRPIAHYLRELRNYPEVTVRQLIHHTGGLPDYMTFVQDYADPEKPVTNQVVLDILRDDTPEVEFAPGERFAYSNTGYLLLASLVERVSGQSFGAFLDQYIFRPLGMPRSSVYQRRYAPRTISDYAYGFLPGETPALPDSTDGYEDVTWLDGVVGDGMVNATAADLRYWVEGVRANKLLPASQTAALYLPGKLADGSTTDYAFGRAVGQSNQYGSVVGHSGSWPGYVTYLAEYPETKRLLIILRNDDGGRRGEFDPDGNLRRLLFGLPLKTVNRSTTFERPLAELESYVGTYYISPTFALDFFLQNDQLYTQATGQQAFPLAPSGVDSFYLEVVDATIAFSLDAEGRPDRLMLYQNGQEIPAQRGEPLTQPEEVTIDPTTLPAYTGTYAIQPTFKLTVSVADETLRVQATGQPAFALYPVAEDAFYNGEVGVKLVFQRNAAGTITGLVLEQAGQTIPAILE